VKSQENTLDNKLRAYDDMIDSIHRLNRGNRDLVESHNAKVRSEADVKANQDRVAYERDQASRGYAQDREREIRDRTEAATSAI